MLPYEHVKSIHDQKMAQFVAEREKDQLSRMTRAGRPGMLDRIAKVAGNAMKSAGETLAARGTRTARAA